MADITDELYDKARKHVLLSQKATISGIQRACEISFTLASSVMERLEKDGVVSPAGDGAGKRNVLLDPDGDERPQDAPGNEPAGGAVTGDGTGEALPPASDEEREAKGWDAEGEHQTALDRMESMVEELDLNPTAIVADIRDFLLDTIKQRPKPWSGTSQEEQRDVIAACQHAADELVRKVVEAVAARGSDSIRVLLTKVAMGSEIVITGKVKTYGEDEEDKAVAQLHRAINKHVMLTRATVEDYRGEDREIDGEPDQRGFGFEADQDE